MKIYKIILFLTAISQIIFTYLTNFTGGSKFNELLITPAGYTFSIWGLITVFSTIYAFWHLFFDKHTFSKKFYLLLSFVYICFTLWLFAAEREILSLTVIIFSAMYASLLYIFSEACKEFDTNKITKVFLQGGIGMYIAWSSVAVVINYFVFIFSFGIVSSSQNGIYLQMLALLCITASAMFTLSKTKYNFVVFATHWWAFVGLLIGLYNRENTSGLIVTALVFVIILNIFYFKNLKR